MKSPEVIIVSFEAVVMHVPILTTKLSQVTCPGNTIFPDSCDLILSLEFNEYPSVPILGSACYRGSNRHHCPGVSSRQGWKNPLPHQGSEVPESSGPPYPSINASNSL